MAVAAVPVVVRRAFPHTVVVVVVRPREYRLKLSPRVLRSG